MSRNFVSVRSGATALDVYALGHLGELTEIIDPELVDAVLEDAGARQQRLRLLPVRVVVYFVLALAFFERSSYQAVWAKLTAGLGNVPVPVRTPRRWPVPGVDWEANRWPTCSRSWPDPWPITASRARSTGACARSPWTAPPCPFPMRKR
ncbi:transposase domain-containing protein [Streptomyces sp. NPDC059787]|uniref:transposase domain-containing protein n=1 Tax=Streptomyces sp. NPDC059787 TaxID=3346947 RepID=UPI0036572E2E